MAKMIVYFSMNGYTEVDLPDNPDEGAIEKAQNEAEKDIARNNTSYLTGSYTIEDYKVE